MAPTKNDTAAAQLSETITFDAFGDVFKSFDADESGMIERQLAIVPDDSQDGTSTLALASLSDPNYERGAMKFKDKGTGQDIMVATWDALHPVLSGEVGGKDMMLVEAVEGTPISKECALYVQVQAGAPDDSKHLGMVKKVLNIVPMNDEVYYNVGTSRPELLSNERKIYVLIGEGGALVAAEDGDAKLSAAEDITMNGAVSIVASAIASSAAADAQVSFVHKMCYILMI